MFLAKTSASVASMIIILSLSVPAAMAASVEVTQCGQVIDAPSAYLSGDLDCQNAAQGVVFSHRGMLELRGFAIRNTLGDGVVCVGGCKIVGPGTIENGQGMGASAGGKLFIDGVTISGHTQEGAFAPRLVVIRNSTVSNNGGNGVSANKVFAEESSIVDNGEDGIHITTGFINGVGRNRIRLNGVVATGNGTSDPPCTSDRTCADINSSVYPVGEIDVTCDTSYNSWLNKPFTDLCALD